MATGDDQDPDDWFSEQEPKRRRQARAPARSAKPERRVAGAAEDWIRDASPSDGERSHQPRSMRALAVAASALVLLLIALAAGGLFSSNSQQPAAPPPTTTGATTAPAQTVPVQRRRPTPPPSTTLKPGDTGVQVKALQRALAHLGYPVGAIDGDYGPATQRAVTSFQRGKGLTGDGVFGPHTLQALTAALRS
jgi:murein L,D-transpeptidase YcbB/YkuD